MEVWFTLVGEYGFPIAITFYLLHRIEKKLDTLNQSVTYLGKILQGTIRPILEAKISANSESTEDHSFIWKNVIDKENIN